MDGWNTILSYCAFAVSFREGNAFQNFSARCGVGCCIGAESAGKILRCCGVGFSQCHNGQGFESFASAPLQTLVSYLNIRVKRVERPWAAISEKMLCLHMRLVDLPILLCIFLFAGILLSKVSRSHPQWRPALFFIHGVIFFRLSSFCFF